MKTSRQLFFIAAIFLFVGAALGSVFLVEPAHAMACVIPENGPWPPCATSGNGSSSTNECVIPTNGPWPPCATNGNAGSPSANNTNGCVIPTSGPWPPCATSGGGSGPVPSGASPSGNNGCVIPTSGPWPPCATSGNAQPAPAQPSAPASGATAVVGGQQILHQGRGAKQSTVAVSGLNSQIANVEVVIDFTYSDTACVAGGSVDRAVLGYALQSPSGTRVDLIDVAQLAGVQAGGRAQMRFADGAPSPIHILTGRFAPADPLSWFDGENPNGTWTVIMFKNDWSDAVCQHSVTLHIVAE